MHADAFYQEPLELLSQGDILDITPHVILKRGPLQVLRSQAGKGGRNILTPYPYDPVLPLAAQETPAGGYRLDQSSGDVVSAHCNVAFGMILSHGCDIDKNAKTRLLALVRPLAAGIPEDFKDIIRRNQKYSAFYLPTNGTMAESYVDLTRLSCPAPEFIDSAPKVASLTDAAVDLLHGQLLRFLTRREFDFEKLMPSEKRDHNE